MQRSDWLLLFVTAEPRCVLDPVRIQKGLFLLGMGEVLPPPERYVFEPYLYGPMSRRLYYDVRRLVRDRHLTAVPIPGARWSGLVAAPRGDALAEALIQRAHRENPDALAEIARIRSTIDGLSFGELLRRVYRDHPEFAGRSVFAQP